MNTFAGDTLKSDKLGLAPRFAVELDNSIIATFSECSGLSATMRTDKWEEGGANYTTLKFPGRVDFSNLTLKHGETDSFDLFNWFLLVLGGKPARKEMTVKLMTYNLEMLREWHFVGVFPVKWTGPTLQTTSNTIAIEAIEFAHDGFINLNEVPYKTKRQEK
jgi:phage tail-like protein